ncbi:hypothetical protein OSC52_13440 [Clostridium pasteurianum]|uniref:hypothetical protein n=1 Tax=Clostridium pasteurianum TaxID=1501 RepID=UPI00226102BA|nr:hypothetical protein [Clostridium pasteurianum]UZW12852.1 hypothetical protein OSC52_13440 [Clostridium pasteurianum]
MADIERKFHTAMVDVYRKADKECGYRATRFLQMLGEKGGVKTAKELISKDGGTEDFLKLWQFGRLDLSIEALVQKDEFKNLFTDEELRMCKERLQKYGYDK